MKKLLDTWAVTGKDLPELYRTLEELTERTHVLQFRTDEIQMLTLRDISDQIYGYINNASGTSNCNIPYSAFNLTYEKNEKNESEKKYLPDRDGILDEISEMKLMFVFGKESFLTTKRVLKTLSQRAGSSMGTFALRDELKIRFHRDGGYVAYMQTVPERCNILYREVDGLKKVYAVFGDRYKEIPQYPLVKHLLEGFETEMGKLNLDYYSVDNFNTDIQISFPEKAGDFGKVYNLPHTITPGLHIHMSDVGESSFIINGTIGYQKATMYMPSAEYARAHTKNAELSEILETVSNRIFPEYTKVPEKLMELLAIDIPEPAKLIPEIASYCGLKKVIGLKAEKEIIENLTLSFAAAAFQVNYTAYDLAVSFMDASVEATDGKKDPKILSNIRTAFMRALYFDYKG